MKKIVINYSSGFTLIEVILYMGIVSMLMVGMITFAWDVVYGREKAAMHLLVEQSARTTMSRMAYEARRAEDFNLVSPTEVQFSTDGETTTVSLTGQSIQLNGVNLTSNQVAVTNFVLTDLSSPGSKQLGIELSVEAAAAAASQRYQADIDLRQAVELNTQFSQSRSLLVDLSSVGLSQNNRDIKGILLENTGDSPVVINQIEISWTGTAGGENLTGIQINGGTQEWTGTAASGTVLDITDVTIAAGASIPIDAFSFDSRVDGGNFLLTYILGDESTLPTTFEFEESSGGGPPGPDPTPIPTPQPTPTPTPGPTASPTPPPPPPTSCATYCQSQNYSTGSCERNANQCNRSGQTYVGAGDSFCTGGPNADTCCCTP